MSKIQADALATRAGTSQVPMLDVINGSAKAWVNFNGVGTVAINASYNVSSITDGGVGVYTVNLTAAMADNKYSVAATSGMASDITTFGVRLGVTSQTVSTFVILCGGGTDAATDRSNVSAAIFR